MVAARSGYPLPEDVQFYRAAGCPACGQIGYRGRTGIYEVLEIDSTFRDAIFHDAPRQDCFRIALANGMHTLAGEGLRKAAEGITSLDEVMPFVRHYEQILMDVPM